jgi:hypothetical protein
MSGQAFILSRSIRARDGDVAGTPGTRSPLIQIELPEVLKD